MSLQVGAGTAPGSSGRIMLLLLSHIFNPVCAVFKNDPSPFKYFSNENNLLVVTCTTKWAKIILVPKGIQMSLNNAGTRDSLTGESISHESEGKECAKKLPITVANSIVLFIWNLLSSSVSILTSFIWWSCEATWVLVLFILTISWCGCKSNHFICLENMWFFKIYFYFAFICMYTAYVCSAQRCQKRALDYVELELQMVVIDHVVDRNWTQGMQEEKPVSLAPICEFCSSSIF